MFIDSPVGIRLAGKKQLPKVSHQELEKLIEESQLFRHADLDIHEAVHPSFRKYKRAKELLLREGLIDAKDDKTPTAMNLVLEIAMKKRAVGTPLEDAIAEYFHMNGLLAGHPTDKLEERLQAKGLLTEDEALTELGWEVILGCMNGKLLRVAIDAWSAESWKRGSARMDWGPLEGYVSRLYGEPKERPPPIQGPANVVQDCNESLKLARLCIIIGAWAGAVQYCSVAVESLLVSVLVGRGLRKPYEEVPALQELAGELGKNLPQVASLTKRLVSLIANFRNDSVHPREPHLRPGEWQARAVHDLTLRFLAEVRDEWFE